ncbi:hypothetical protein ABFS82_12G085400 [Erythranthe guttata]
MTHEAAWTTKHIKQLKQSKLGISSSTSTMGETTTLALCGQALGAVMANVLSTNTNNDNSSSCSWAVCLVEFGVVLGLSFTLAGIGLRGKQRRPFLSLLLTKILRYFIRYYLTGFATSAAHGMDLQPRRFLHCGGGGGVGLIIIIIII